MDSSSNGQNDPINAIDSNQSEQETATSLKSKVKRKPVRPRSTVWDHFTKFKTDDGDTKGKCNYCNKEFYCDPKRNGTTALRNHMNICKKHPQAIETRCMAHIVNLVVMDGLKDVGESVLKVEFNLLDVEYNSKYERAFERYESQEPMFRLELGKNGVPDFHDWFECRKMAEMLSHFYELTLHIFNSRYVTSNMFFGEISDLAFIMNQWVDSTDIEVKNIGDRMKKKFDKYWEDIDKMNKLIYFAAVPDPRDKFEYMEFQFCQMHGEEKGE
ncbi:hypothetical protein GH714_001507 [Hevea brasiliensis]|uniref:BED-type domain-containing protein n=1 Tax=Hevea brasiliensis TaxID=3981 RepID=A0A6A6M7P8_HEVBR|nr:hypothetical protein GH714_001507 [Hevea brasiliensis]